MAKGHNLLAGLLLASMLPSWAQSGTDRQLRIGSSMPLTGPLAAHAKLLAGGAKHYFDSVNQAGGINGARVDFQMLVDAFDPAKAAENCRVLIMERDAIALISNPGTSQALAALPIVSTTGTPLFAPVIGALQLRKQKLASLFHVRASFNDELQHIVDHATALGIQRIGLFHTYDAVGRSMLEELRGILAAHGLPLAAVSGASFEQGNIAQAASLLWQLKTRSIVVGAVGLNFGKFVAAYKALGGAASQIYGLSVVDPAAMKDMNIAKHCRGRGQAPSPQCSNWTLS